jgi:hypothetical protein
VTVTSVFRVHRRRERTNYGWKVLSREVSSCESAGEWLVELWRLIWEGGRSVTESSRPFNEFLYEVFAELKRFRRRFILLWWG